MVTARRLPAILSLSRAPRAWSGPSAARAATPPRNGRAYIVSISGGPTGQGQVFEYDPASETMKVLFRPRTPASSATRTTSASRPVAESCCARTATAASTCHGLTQDGTILPFALNQVVIPQGGVPGKSVAAGNYSGSEWCGSVFDTTNSHWLFANAQSPGITFAITGPWRTGSL